LEGQGVIETLAGKGCFVKGNHSPFRKEIRQQLLAEEIDAAVVQAHHLRISKDDFLKLSKQRYERFEEKRAAAENSSPGTSL
jgi:DNA-binding transcriptional regulator YhcF (GntR family)